MDFSIADDIDFQKYCTKTYGSIDNLKSKAKNGEIVAQADLGMAYLEGFGDELPKDNDAAIGWLNAAVEKGYEVPSILGKLGELLDRKGTPLHQRKAYDMYHRAAKLGCSNSQLNLAEMYRCGVEGLLIEDLNEAFLWYKKAAGEDPSDENSDLGAFHRLRVGTMKKVEDVGGGFMKLRALTSLFNYYLIGDCPEGRPQPTKAVYYLTRAAELGDTEAQRKLGEIYLTGSCEQMKDVVKARRWLGKASSKGDIGAKQLLEQCIQSADIPPVVTDDSKEAFRQSFEIWKEKKIRRCEANVHPFVISQPIIFSEEMLIEFKSSPTARIYLQAFKLVKEGLEILWKSNFTEEKGISLIADGYLMEYSILQSFPVNELLLSQVFCLCEQSLQKNPCFFEGLVLSLAFHHSERKISVESLKVDFKKVMCVKNLIHLIQTAEPNSITSEDSMKFGKYSSWLHVLYEILGSLYVVAFKNEKAAEAFEQSLKYCPSHLNSKRGLGYSLLQLYEFRLAHDKVSKDKTVAKPTLPSKQTAEDREISKYTSWTNKQLADTCESILKEFLEEAPPCCKTYPNVCYYLASLALSKQNREEFKKYYEQGQDAEEKRLPFLDRVELPLKDELNLFYQLFSDVKISVRCGNSACKKEVNQRDLKLCARCRNQKYCSKDCQRADWKNHKATCNASKGHNAK